MDFFPARITMLMNFAISSLPYKGSGKISLFIAAFLLGIVISYLILLLWFFRTVFGTTFTTAFNTGCIEASANDVITHTWQVFYTTTADHHDRVFLQVVAFTADVGSDFKFVGQTHTSHLT